MNLEPTIQNEVRQKEKNIYILMHIYGIQKDGIDEPTCRAAIETQIQRTDLQTRVGERKERVTQRRSMEKCTLTYVE